MHSNRPAAVLALVLGSLTCACKSVSYEGAAGSGRELLTLEQTSLQEERVNFSGTLPDYRWAPDGVHLVLGEEEETVWIDPATWNESAPPADEAEDELCKLFQAEGLEEERARELAETEPQTGENGIELRASEGELWIVRDGQVSFLKPAESVELELAELSPDGERVAYVQGNDLFIVDIETGDTRALSSDGGHTVFNGKLDWVYQEELYGRSDFKAFWWSPDSKHIAFLRLDESEVYDFTVVDHIEDGHFRIKPEITKYPKVGDPNPTVGLGIADAVADVEGRTAVRWVDLSSYESEEPLVVRVGWTPSGDEVVYMLQDRIQTWLDLCFAKPASGDSRTVFRETSSTWTDRASAPRWLADGTFLWMSDRTGQRHVLRYQANGEYVGAVTDGDWGVVRIDEVDEEQGVMWFSSTKDGAVNANTYRINLDGTGMKRLTQADGRHSVTWNDARTLFLDRFSSLAHPPRLRLCDAEGVVVKELGEADIPALDEYATSTWEYLTIEARDGVELDVALLKPIPFDPNASYPVWVPTYSGPNAPSVRNSWNGSAWYQFLAENGVVVLQVNVRSASGKGRESTALAYRQLGIPELCDLEDAVDWVTSNGWADAERVGITGSSYGGFMTAFALTHSDRFAVGIAASGVYDWAMYDTIYTERYMATPALNPDGYASTSVIAAAADLQGHLVLTHGVMDDNVHLQNTIQLVYALQKAGRDFELMLYPQSRHGIRDPEQRWHHRRIEWRTIRNQLLAEQS